jgi:hypothetical protein
LYGFTFVIAFILIYFQNCGFLWYAIELTKTMSERGMVPSFDSPVSRALFFIVNFEKATVNHIFKVGVGKLSKCIIFDGFTTPKMMREHIQTATERQRFHSKDIFVRGSHRNSGMLPLEIDLHSMDSTQAVSLVGSAINFFSKCHQIYAIARVTEIQLAFIVGHGHNSFIRGGILRKVITKYLKNNNISYTVCSNIISLLYDNSSSNTYENDSGAIVMVNVKQKMCGDDFPICNKGTYDPLYCDDTVMTSPEIAHHIKTENGTGDGSINICDNYDVKASLDTNIYGSIASNVNKSVISSPRTLSMTHHRRKQRKNNKAIDVLNGSINNQNIDLALLSGNTYLNTDTINASVQSLKSSKIKFTTKNSFSALESEFEFESPSKSEHTSLFSTTTTTTTSPKDRASRRSSLWPILSLSYLDKTTKSPTKNSNWACPTCTFSNFEALFECEMCGTTQDAYL